MKTYSCNGITVQARSSYYAARKIARAVLKLDGEDFPLSARIRKVSYTPEPNVFLVFADWEDRSDGSTTDSFFEIRLAPCDV
jgi:hypothetical protein